MSEDYVNVPIVMNSGGGYPVPQHATPNDPADLIEKIKPETAVELMRHRLLGEEWIGNQWKSIGAMKDTKLSEVGAWELSSLLLGVGNINVSISRYGQRAIQERLFRIARTAQKMMLTKWELYGIKSVSQFWFVHEILFTSAQAVLNQAEDGSIQELIKGVGRGNIGDQGNMAYYNKEPATRRIGRALGLIS